MLSRPYAFGCVLRLRTSSEFKTGHSYGHFFPDPQYENVQHIICCDSYATYAYDFEFEATKEFSKHGSEPPIIQIAFQYTEQEILGKENGGKSGIVEKREKQGSNWNFIQDDIEDLIETDGEENWSVDVDRDVLVRSDSSHDDCSDIEFSLVEGKQDADPLEDEIFSLEGFMEGQATSSTKVPIPEEM